MRNRVHENSAMLTHDVGTPAVRQRRSPWGRKKPTLHDSDGWLLQAAEDANSISDIEIGKRYAAKVGDSSVRSTDSKLSNIL